MSDEKENTAKEGTAVGTVVEKKEEVVGTAKKVFTRNDVKKYVQVQVYLPHIYPDYDPWIFKLRLKLTSDAEDRRQEYLSLAPAKQVEKEDEYYLDEVSDLLIELPTGFGDLMDTGQGPGHSFKSYVETADPHAKDTLFAIVKGVSVLYWRYTSPHEFRK